MISNFDLFCSMTEKGLKPSSGWIPGGSTGRGLSLVGILCLLVFLAATPGAARAADLKITAAFEEAEITQGQQAVLYVTVSGTTNAKVTMPEVSGLQIADAGKRTQMQIVNFSRMDTVTYIYRVIGFEPGTYTIPAIAVESNGVTQKSQEVSLTILKSSAPEAAAAGPGGGGSSDGKVSLDANEVQQPYILQMDLKEDHLYVGQVAAVTCRLFVRAGYRFAPKSAPALSSDAFTMEKQNSQKYEVGINGVGYYMEMWETSVTAIKAGEYTLELKLPMEVLDRDRILGGASSLSDPFITRGFVRSIELKSKPLKVTVSALPKENKPASFSGAIGTFTFVGQPSTTDLNAGEPMELTVAIEGRGNFGRIDWPGTPQNRLWRSYPPTSSFKAIDAAGVEGKKTYKQALIPLSSEIKEIPMQEFSYFDPVTGQYKTLRTDPVALKVRAAAEAALSGNNDVTAQRSSLTGAEDTLGLLPNRLATGNLSHSLKPWKSQSWFYWILAIPALLVLSAFGFRAYPYLSDQLQGGGKARALDRALAAELQAMQSALQQSDSESFAQRARRVLQQSLARRWGCPPESVTRHEVRQRQPQGGQELENLFAALDAVDYSGAALTEEEMKKIDSGIQSWLQQGKGGAGV